MLIRVWAFQWQKFKNLHIWACCNQIRQHSPFIIYAVWLTFNKMPEICVAILDDRLVLLIFMKWSQIFLRYLEHLEKNFETFRKKNSEFPETYLGDFSWYLYLGLTVDSMKGVFNVPRRKPNLVPRVLSPTCVNIANVLLKIMGRWSLPSCSNCGQRYPLDKFLFRG